MPSESWRILPKTEAHTTSTTRLKICHLLWLRGVTITKIYLFLEPQTTGFWRRKIAIFWGPKMIGSCCPLTYTLEAALLMPSLTLKTLSRDTNLGKHRSSIRACLRSTCRRKNRPQTSGRVPNPVSSPKWWRTTKRWWGIWIKSGAIPSKATSLTTTWVKKTKKWPTYLQTWTLRKKAWGRCLQIST